MAQLIRSGYLHKAPPKDKLKHKFADKWRLRWFKLFANKTFTYSEDINSVKLKGEIPLDKVELSDIRHGLTVEKRKFVVSINVTALNREYFLAANDQDTMMGWYNAIREVLKIDYILVSEVASSNTLKREAIESSESLDAKAKSSEEERYLELKAEKLERISIGISISLNEPDEENALPPLDLDRASKVSPYETYNLDSKKSEDYYIPMQAINSLESYPNEQDIIPIQDETKSLELEENRPSRKTSDYEIADLQDLDPTSPIERNENVKFHNYVNLAIAEEPTEPSSSPPLPTELKSLNSDYSDFDVQPEDETSRLEVQEVQPKVSEEIYMAMNIPCADKPNPLHSYDRLEDIQVFMQRMEEKRKSERSYKGDYDDLDVLAMTMKSGSTSDAVSPPVRVGRSLTEIETDPDVFEPPTLPPKGAGLALLEELRRTSYGNFPALLENYWVMYIFLPNKHIIKELVNLECPVDVLLSKLARLFARHKDLHDFNLYVVSDIHQTFESGRKNDKDTVKNDKRLNNETSFLKQGINASKLLQLISIKEIDQKIFKEYMREKTEMNTAQRFCETWIPFVRGYFSIPDLREVACLGGYIHYVYQTTFLSKAISHEIFLPKNSRDIPECVKRAKDQSLELKDTSVETACVNFMKRISVWPTANTIAFPIKRIGKGVLMNKQSDFLFVFASDHIGVVKAEKNTDYSNFVYWWHKLDISGFQLNTQKDILIIKLTKPVEEGSCDFQIKSSMNKILAQLLENFFAEKQTLAKRASIDANASRTIFKEATHVT